MKSHMVLLSWAAAFLLFCSFSFTRLNGGNMALRVSSTGSIMPKIPSGAISLSSVDELSSHHRLLALYKQQAHEMQHLLLLSLTPRSSTYPPSRYLYICCYPHITLGRSTLYCSNGKIITFCNNALRCNLRGKAPIDVFQVSECVGNTTRSR